MLIRPVQVADLPAMERMAIASGIGVTNLPDNRETLFERIRLSAHSLESDVAIHGPEFYQFVLEVDDEIVGTAAIAASAGFSEPFYSYRNETLVHASPSLKVYNRIHALTLCHDLTGESQLCAFFLDQAARHHSGASELLSKSRLLFMANHPERFSERVIAEMVGFCDENERSPFWDAIARKFFNMEYRDAQYLIGTRNKTFVAELMPSYPIYVSLLPDDAQHVIGQIHPDAELAFSLLTDEGFESENYLDIFTGAPALTAKLSHLRSVTHSETARVEISTLRPGGIEPCLVCNTLIQDFRASFAGVILREGTIWLTPALADALLVQAGDRVRVTRLSSVKMELVPC